MAWKEWALQAERAENEAAKQKRESAERKAKRQG